MNGFLDQIYYNNTILEYLISAGVIVVGVLLVFAFKRLIIKRLRQWADKTATSWDDFFVESVARFGIPIVQWLIVYWAIHLLDLSERSDRFIAIAASILITFYLVRLVTSVVMTLLKSGIRKHERGEEKIKQLGGLMIIISIFIWILGILLLLTNWGVEVTPIITGLGIGGIAVALAAQNILGDLFAYFVIFFDRPFEAGDFIVVDDKKGTIEYVGIKTTHIRSLSGEQIIIGNANLTNSRIQNYKRMERRRIDFSIDVEYGTPFETVAKVPALLRSIIEEQQEATFDRAHFASYQDWSLRYDVVYFVLSPDFNKYMDIQQKVNLRIYEEFSKQKIEFAFPSQSLYVKNSLKVNSSVPAESGTNGRI